MPNWVSENRSNITFLVSLFLGVAAVVVGLGIFNEPQPGYVAVGAGIIGIPGFSNATGGKKDES